MPQLFNEPVYRRHLMGRGNHQYVMIGYSASNKESGIVRSRWLLRKAQERLFAVADDAGIDLTLFHGQGDGVDRGGGRTEVTRAQRSRRCAARPAAHHRAGRAHQREIRIAADRAACVRAGVQRVVAVARAA